MPENTTVDAPVIITSGDDEEIVARRKALQEKRDKLAAVSAERSEKAVASDKEIRLAAFDREEAELDAQLEYERVAAKVLEDARKQKEARERGEEYVSEVYSEDPNVAPKTVVTNEPPDNSTVLVESGTPVVNVPVPPSLPSDTDESDITSEDDKNEE